MDIVVVANKKRPPLIVKHLVEHPHHVSFTPEFPFDRKYNPPPEYRELNIPNHVGPFRCFRGHQEAIRKCHGEKILVFEDDAVPKKSNWFETATICLELLNDYEIVSLHGRNIIEESKFAWKGMSFFIPGGPGHSVIKWCLGSLAYLIKQETAQKILAMEYDGLPMDLLLATKFKFCVMDFSPFNHDRRYGSLVEKAR